jgi:hypothetical protein
VQGNKDEDFSREHARNGRRMQESLQQQEDSGKRKPCATSGSVVLEISSKAKTSAKVILEQNRVSTRTSVFGGISSPMLSFVRRSINGASSLWACKLKRLEYVTARVSTCQHLHRHELDCLLGSKKGGLGSMKKS